jgi:nitrile hydratase
VNGIHDMGGMHGFGPVMPEEDEPVFHEEWERRVFGVPRALPPGFGPTGGMRYRIERMDPADYLASSYYERWLDAIETGLIEAGVVSREQLAGRIAYYKDNPSATVPRRENPAQIERALARIREPQVLNRPGGLAPRFQVGDRVRARNIHPVGHTRLPRYVRGKLGQVSRLLGIHDFQDTDPHGQRIGEPQAVYSVCFTGEELWGPSAEANSEIYLDLWDSYLESDGEPA